MATKTERADAKDVAGELLLSSIRDGTVRLWTSRGRLRRTLDLEGDPVLDVAFSPNGDLIASASARGIIALHDVKSGDRVASLAGHTSGVRAVAFSPNGTLLASAAWWLRHEAADQASIRLWDVASGAEVASRFDHDLRVADLAFSPDGRRLVTVADGRMNFWGVDEGRLLSSTEGAGTALAFSPDGRRLITTADRSFVRVWDVDRVQNVLTLRMQERTVDTRVFAGPTAVAFGPNGEWIVAGSADGRLHIWDAASATERYPGYSVQRLYARFEEQAGVLAELAKTRMPAARRARMLTSVERIGVARSGD